MKIQQILTSEEFNSLQFKKEEIEWLESRIQTRKDGKAGVECVVRGKNNDDLFELKPEECVRQLLAHQLIETYKYPKELLEFETQVTFHGHEKTDDKRIDIAIYDKEHKNIEVVIEVKRPSVTNITKADDGGASPLQQMQSYCKQVSAKVGVIANGANVLKFYEAPKFDKELNVSAFPNFGQDLTEWKRGERWTLLELIQNDRLQTETLKDIIANVEQRFAANDSSDKSFDELLKLIFIKLYDERKSGENATVIEHEVKRGKKQGLSEIETLKTIDSEDFRPLEFRIKPGESMEDAFKRLDDIFIKAQKEWSNVFATNSHLNMQAETLTSCVKELYRVKLFNSNLEVVDDAFENLVNKNQKGEMGQYFTPRYVIDMCVKMLNPQQHETMIDTASGSAGFPMHTVFHVWKQLSPDKLNLMTSPNRSDEETNYVKNNVFGLDFSEKSVQVGRMLNIIAGDGHANVIYINSLDYKNWEKTYKNNPNWSLKYGEGFSKIEALSKNANALNPADKYRAFNFDILMANPPFAGDLDNKEQLNQYELSLNDKGKLQNKVGRDILFIERNLNFLKPGGRMAIVLPQGRFNNSSDKYIRNYIAKQCRLLAVVGLHGNVFKPHTGTKTSVLFVQKWDDELCPYQEDYNIFFATMLEPSKDNSGDKIYVTENYITSWNSYTYHTYKTITHKKYGNEIFEFEYEQAENKSDYRVRFEEDIIPNFHTEELKEIHYIKDLFVEKYGNPEDHKKYICKNVQFTLKQTKANTKQQPQTISIEQYLQLPKTQKALYNEQPIEGENKNPLISQSEYAALNAETKKFYLVAEEVKERTERVKDTHGHIFVRHDLFNHDPELKNLNPANIYSQDGIAEAFIEFAKKEKLSFAPF